MKKRFNFTEFSFILIRKKLVKSISRNFCLQHGRKIFEDDVIVIIFNKHSMYYKNFFSSIKKREDVKKNWVFLELLEFTAPHLVR